MLALCVAAPYQLGMTESIGLSRYRNTSPPVASTLGGVTIGLAHSRYLTVEALTLSLTNHTGEPVYLPAEGEPLPPIRDQYLHATPDGSSCLALETDVLSAHGWQILGGGCRWWVWSCGDADPGFPVPAVLAIAPGETARFTLYDPTDAYPLWSPGVYRIRIPYSQTPFQPPERWSRWQYPLVIPLSETLVTPPVSLTRAWWYPADYHRTPPKCAGS